MLPDYSHLPVWVRWIAQDADGVWWAYQNEPNMSESGWYENEVGQSMRVQAGVPNPFWRAAIYSIEKSNQ